MKQFRSIENIDTGILYCLELASSISILLLAFGLIASMANVLTKGAVLTDHVWMQQVWAWTQCIAIDASVAGTIIRTFRYHAEGEKAKAWLSGLLSILLLFTAAIVSNIEAVQQTLNLTLASAYMHVFVPVEALIWIRSIAIVFLIVAHAMRHVQVAKLPKAANQKQGAPSVVTPELVETLRSLLAPTTVTEEANTPPLLLAEGEQETNNGERVRVYLVDHPKATLREIAEALSISVTTVNKWRTRIQGEGKRVKRTRARKT
jgi:hypothetical protein